MNNNFLHLGGDLIMGANKVFGAPGGLQMLSQVVNTGTQYQINCVDLRKRLRPLEIKIEHGSFYIGDGAYDYGYQVDNLDFDRLTGVLEMKAMLFGYLTH